MREKQYFETDSSALRGSTGKYMNPVDFSPDLRLSQQYQFLTSGFFLLKTVFKEGTNRNKGDCHQWRIISFLKKKPLLKISFRYFSRSARSTKYYQIDKEQSHYRPAQAQKVPGV